MLLCDPDMQTTPGSSTIAFNEFSSNGNTWLSWVLVGSSNAFNVVLAPFGLLEDYIKIDCDLWLISPMPFTMYEVCYGSLALKSMEGDGTPLGRVFLLMKGTVQVCFWFSMYRVAATGCAVILS